MTTFIRALEDEDKESILSSAVANFRSGKASPRLHFIDTSLFEVLPGKPFAYWISDGVKRAFTALPCFDDLSFDAQFGGSTKDDFRFLRLWWESNNYHGQKWFPFAKGGAVSPFYADIYLSVNWKNDAAELEAAILGKYPYLGESANWVLHRESSYGRPGITWTRRTKSRFSPRVLPGHCIFSEKGLSAFSEGDSPEDIFSLLAVLSSSSFRRMIEIQLSAADAKAGGAANSYEIGIIQSSPFPRLTDKSKEVLAGLAKQGWFLKREQDRGNEASHAFTLPVPLLNRVASQVPGGRSSLDEVEATINGLVAEAYGLSAIEAADRPVHFKAVANVRETDQHELIEDEEEDDPVDESNDAGLHSWAVGVAFGRFDCRLATGEREPPPAASPFDPLPSKSPGMLPDAADSPVHPRIMVDDIGHQQDLTHAIERVLERVGQPVPTDLRRWLQRDFFAFHLRRYSKSRRKAPIYWPLATPSGSYTLWIYYSSLSSQTLYTAVNDFVEPKVKLLGEQVVALRNKGNSRTREDEKQFESLQSFELELIGLRDALLKLAPIYKPNHDDGVQISAAPLWPLFRLKPWQKVLKDTWDKLAKGDYDWAHLAMNYWPDRVREKCKTDKSLAIAHGLESLYVEPEAKPKKTRGRKKAGEDA